MFMKKKKKEQAIKQALASLNMDQIYLPREYIETYARQKSCGSKNKELTLERRTNDANKR